MFDSYLGESMLARARERKLMEFRVHDLRDFSSDTKHRRVDDKPYGGGPGMVVKIESMARAIGSILRIRNQESGIRKETLIVLFSPAGKQFSSKIAQGWARKYKRIVMVCGRYEGIDGRIKSVIRDSKFMIQEVSVGPYVLTGGELPAMIVADAVARHIPGVLGNEESLEERRYGVGVPVYTRPEVFEWTVNGQGKRKKKYRVPAVLLSGDHKKIDRWRQQKK